LSIEYVNMIRLSVALFLIVQLTHCRPKERKVTSYKYIPESSWEMLNDLPEYHGDTVLLTRFLHYNFEDVALYRTKNSETVEALWLSSIERRLTKRLDSFYSSEVKVLGVIDTTSHGHLGLYAGEFKPISVNEVR